LFSHSYLDDRAWLGPAVDTASSKIRPAGFGYGIDLVIEVVGVVLGADLLVNAARSERT
jgi:hypothetical protein